MGYIYIYNSGKWYKIKVLNSGVHIEYRYIKWYRIIWGFYYRMYRVIKEVLCRKTERFIKGNTEKFLKTTYSLMGVVKGNPQNKIGGVIYGN